MRAVIQRVTSSSVTVNNVLINEIDCGLNVLLGIKYDDDESKIKYLADKILNLRIFEDEKGKMNLSINDVKGQILIISQFTLYGDCKKGNRPSFNEAMEATKANDLYVSFIDYLKRNSTIVIKSGVFGANMDVKIINDGPVTILIESK